ncbi:MAG: hypothetical protein A2X94_17405 [Bdellovibrionales bacterium GWB1_55_8]|nr:MAG: hypothetical protein A2X94_17405 [Bdellovibrionales bacterium GWB1_55_8]
MRLKSAVIRAAFLLFLMLPSLTVPASAADKVTGIRFVKMGTQRIATLKWGDRVPDVRVEPSTASQHGRVLALIEGAFLRPDWNLLVNSRRVPRSKEGKFKFWFPLRGPVTEIEAIAVGPFGDIERERISIQTEGFEYGSRAVAPTPSGSGAKQFFFSPGLGVSVLGYRQTDLPNVDQIVLTGKMGVVHLLAPAWDVGVSGYLTLAPLVTGSADVARFLGVNARVGYTLPFVRAPWKVAVLAGGYFTTMFVSSGAFGFKNMAGPQLFPSVRYALADGASAWLYGKFSPVSDGVASLSFKNRELAAGGGYSFKPVNGRSLSITLDVAELALQVEEDVVSSTSFSVGIGIGF